MWSVGSASFAGEANDSDQDKIREVLEEDLVVKEEEEGWDEEVDEVGNGEGC